MKKLLIIIPFFIIGCATKNTVNNYTLNSYPVESQNTQKTLSLSISAPPAFQTRKIYWQKGYEKNPYLYSQWIEDFDTLLQKSVFNALFDSHKFKSVYQDKKADLNLQLYIAEASHVVTQNGSYVILDIKAYLNSRSKDFYYKIPCQKNAKGAVEAFNKAVKRFEKELIDWL